MKQSDMVSNAVNNVYSAWRVWARHFRGDAVAMARNIRFAASFGVMNDLDVTWDRACELVGIVESALCEMTPEDSLVCDWSQIVELYADDNR